MTTPFIIGLLAILFLVTEWILAFGLDANDADVKIIFAGLLGSILTMVGTIVNHNWGSSKSSEQKTAILAELNSKTPHGAHSVQKTETTQSTTTEIKGTENEESKTP